MLAHIRNIGVSLIGAAIFGGIARYFGGASSGFIVALVVGIAFLVTSEIVGRRWAHEAKGSVPPHLSLTYESHGSYAAMFPITGVPPFRETIEVGVRLVAALEEGHPTVELLKGTARVKCDGGRPQRIKVLVHPHIRLSGDQTNSSSVYPIILAGSSVELTCIMFPYAEPSPTGGWIVPHVVRITRLVVVDQHRRKYKLKDEIQLPGSFISDVISFRNSQNPW